MTKPKGAVLMTTPSLLNMSINDLAQIEKGQKFYAIESENIYRELRMTTKDIILGLVFGVDKDGTERSYKIGNVQLNPNLPVRLYIKFFDNADIFL
ncbi:MAG: hypothetical protein ACI4TD_05280 [Phocaeicola sp.]